MVKRKPNQSGATRDEPVKWRPSSLIDSLRGLAAGRRYRWLDKDPANLAKKQAEGWEISSSLKGDNAEHVRQGTLNDGNPMTPSLTEYRDLILASMPEELAQAREKYYQEKSDEALGRLVTDPKEKARRVGGEIEVSLKNLA